MACAGRGILEFSRFVAASLLTGVVAAGCDVNAVPGEGAAESSYMQDRPGLSVTALDADGAPVFGAWVALEPGPWEAQTDGDGVARFTALGAGAWAVRVSAQGYVEVADALELGEEDGALTVTLALADAAGTTLAGAVTDPQGAPVEGAGVWLDEARVASTDASGAFEARGLLGGDWPLRVTAPDGSGLMDWALPSLVLEQGARAEIAVTLGGQPPDGADYVGSSRCLACHTELADGYSGSAHATAGRDPGALDAGLDGLSAAFLAGDTVDLDDLGASALLSVEGGAWVVTLLDAGGATTGPMEVVEVYGGHRAGAALAVQVGGAEATLPIVWALPGQGLSSRQHEAGWVTAYTDGWFDASGDLSLDAAGRPGAAASFALQCAGCHATGAALSEAGGVYTLGSASDLSSEPPERAVGCEACHGPGSAHAASTSPAEILNPSRLPSHQRVEVCARCHERTSPVDHPFSEAPGYPVDGGGALLGPADTVADYAEPASVRWLEAPASRLGWDQVGDLRSSPHLAGPQGYAAACEDCHDSHGGPFKASLRAAPTDNGLCTTCHAADFPDEAAEASHSHHGSFHPGDWSPGACTGCHMPRLGVSVRVDAVSGAGELHAHSLDFIEPAASLAEFDAAGATTLPLGSAPLPACLDCHIQADAEAEDEGGNCPCPVGSARKRVTYEDFQTAYELVWGLR